MIDLSQKREDEYCHVMVGHSGFSGDRHCDVIGLLKKYEQEIKHETLTDEVVYNAKRENYTDTNINGEHVDIGVEVNR